MARRSLRDNVSLPGANHLMLEQEPAWSQFLEELGLFLNWSRNKEQQQP